MKFRVIFTLDHRLVQERCLAAMRSSRIPGLPVRFGDWTTIDLFPEQPFTLTGAMIEAHHLSKSGKMLDTGFDPFETFSEALEFKLTHESDGIAIEIVETAS